MMMPLYLPVPSTFHRSDAKSGREDLLTTTVLKGWLAGRRECCLQEANACSGSGQSESLRGASACSLSTPMQPRVTCFVRRSVRERSAR
jgi:hypothetical protein